MSQPYELTDDQYRWADSPGDPEGPVTDEPMVERMEALEAVATCRPWEVYETQGDEYGIRGGPLCSEGCCQDIIVYDGPSEADANFIVATRNDLPALLSQLREQREVIEAVREEHGFRHLSEFQDPPRAVCKCNGWLDSCPIAIALAAMAPDTEEGTE